MLRLRFSLGAFAVGIGSAREVFANGRGTMRLAGALIGVRQQKKRLRVQVWRRARAFRRRIWRGAQNLHGAGALPLADQNLREQSARRQVVRALVKDGLRVRERFRILVQVGFALGAHKPSKTVLWMFRSTRSSCSMAAARSPLPCNADAR